MLCVIRYGRDTREVSRFTELLDSINGVAEREKEFSEWKAREGWPLAKIAMADEVLEALSGSLSAADGADDDGEEEEAQPVSAAAAAEEETEEAEAAEAVAMEPKGRGGEAVETGDARGKAADLAEEEEDGRSTKSSEDAAADAGDEVEEEEEQESEGTGEVEEVSGDPDEGEVAELLEGVSAEAIADAAVEAQEE